MTKVEGDVRSKNSWSSLSDKYWGRLPTNTCWLSGNTCTGIDARRPSSPSNEPWARPLASVSDSSWLATALTNHTALTQLTEPLISGTNYPCEWIANLLSPISIWISVENILLLWILVVTITSRINCLERPVSKMAYYLSSECVGSDVPLNT